MAEQYKHTQIGYLTLAMLGAATLLMVVLVVAAGFHWIPLVVLVVLAVGLPLFATLSVEVHEGSVRIWFGPGVIRKRFQVQDIVACQVVRNPWYYGWGIRLTPHGWLYNVSGYSAVELQMKSGKRYRIGTDKPEQLQKAVERVLEEQRSDPA